jgi:hypothetical protein
MRIAVPEAELSELQRRLLAFRLAPGVHPAEDLALRGPVRVPARTRHPLELTMRLARPGYRWDWLPELFSDLRTVSRYDRGGHFAAVERPDVIVDALRRLAREVDAPIAVHPSIR